MLQDESSVSWDFTPVDSTRKYHNSVSIQRFWGASTIYHESRGQPLYGQECVGHVILNRAILRNMSVKNVCLQPKQFSCFNENRYPPIKNKDAFDTAEKMFNLAHERRLFGFDFFGADHYHATYMDPYPSWAKSMEIIAVIGQHIFYKS